MKGRHPPGSRASAGGSAAFRRSYAAALRACMKAEADPGPGSAERLGERAYAMGLDIVALVEIHHAALLGTAARQGDARGRPVLAARAATFLAGVLDSFASARVPVEGTVAAERRRTARETGRREVMQEALSTSEDRNRVLVRHSRDMEEELRLLTRRLLATQEEERRRISRELHDAMGQTLTGIHLHLAALGREAGTAAKGLRSRIAETRKLVQQSMKTVHRFAKDLRPDHLEELGLVPALRTLLRDFAWGEGVRVRLRTTGEFTGLGSAPSTALFRVAQEALTNVHRHAEASNVRVTLERIPDAVRMTVWNDGRSFDVERRDRSRNDRHLGLLCMRERMDMTGGTISIRSSPEDGTTVQAEVPLSG